MSTDIPGAGVYGQAVALAKKRYQQRLADINKQRQSTMRTAGFTGDIDPETGLISGMRTDPYNRYGAYQQLNRVQAQRADEQFSENVGRGLGRGGLAAQNLGNLRYDFGREDASFGANLADQLAGLTRQQDEDRFAYDQALYEAQLEAARAAAEAGDYGYADGGEGASEYEYPYPLPPGGDYPSGVAGGGAIMSGRAPVGTRSVPGRPSRPVVRRPLPAGVLRGDRGRTPSRPKTVTKRPAAKPAGIRR